MVSTVACSCLRLNSLCGERSSLLPGGQEFPAAKPVSCAGEADAGTAQP